jgi:hypothetical protein
VHRSLVLQHAPGTETGHDIALYLRHNLAKLMDRLIAVREDSTRWTPNCNIPVADASQIGLPLLYLSFNGFYAS